jgi:hypothetical protein
LLLLQLHYLLSIGVFPDLFVEVPPLVEHRYIAQDVDQLPHAHALVVELLLLFGRDADGCGEVGGQRAQLRVKMRHQEVVKDLLDPVIEDPLHLLHLRNGKVAQLDEVTRH